MFNKKLMAVTVAASFIVAAGSAFADDANTIDINFKGHVTSPTCTLAKQDNTVTLDNIDLAKINALSVGGATATGEKRFSLHLSCPDQISENNVTLTLTADHDESTATVLKNNAAEDVSASGVGFEIFSELGENQSTPLSLDGSPVAASDYISRLNKNDDDNIAFKVEYARTASEVTAGDLASKATFSFTYK
ncbi:fimbrial protein [Enterobacteriaceae bacterium C23F]